MLSRLLRDRTLAGLRSASSRFECKYILDPLTLPALRQFVQSVAWVDPFSAARPDRRYSICSLYLDTDDLLFYHQYLRGERSRCKLRVRTYSDDPATPAYLEVKARINGIVSKRRAVVTRQEVDRIIGRRCTHGAAARDARRLPAFDCFVTEMALTSCKPIVRVRYRREAYIAPGHEPVRVTFDTDVRYQATFGSSLSHEGGHWLATRLDGVILEIKFTDRFPSWVEHMVRAFGLKQERCSKFATAIEHMLARGGAALSCAGFTLPAAALGARI